MEYGIYEKINDEIINMLEEKYLKDVHKEMKKFQIVMTGYNASKYKSLQVFKKYGWKLTPLLGSVWMTCSFVKKISSKIVVSYILRKNMKTGILTSSLLAKESLVYISIKIDKTDEIFEYIKSLGRLVRFDIPNTFGNYSLRYRVSVIYNGNEVEYLINASYPCSL